VKFSEMNTITSELELQLRAPDSHSSLPTVIAHIKHNDSKIQHQIYIT
jgi:hypothetical protein